MQPSRDRPGQARSLDSDRGLVDAFSRRRDELAFRALYRRHSPYLYALACRITGAPPAVAEELVQDTWVRAVEKIDRFEWRSKFRTWLSGIMINCHRERLRKKPIRSGGESSDHASPPPSVVESIDLEEALAQLADGYREVVVLHYLYGYKHHEIAELLGISSGTSKSQASRGIKRLRSIMGRR